jgi:xanthine/uracil permease
MLERLKAAFLVRDEGRRETPGDISYGLTQRPPTPLLLVCGVQHALVALMFTLYAVLAARGAGLSPAAATGFMGLTIVIMGIATVLQALPTRLGAGRIMVQIPNPLSMAVFVVIAQAHGLGAAGGALLLAAVVMLGVGRALPYLRSILPPEVSGVVVLLVGVELVNGGAGRFVGYAAETGIDGSSALIAVVTLTGIVALSVWGRGQVKAFAVLAGVAAGLAVALTTTDFGAVASGAVAGQPVLALPGMGFDIPSPVIIFSAAIPLIVTELLTVLDHVGTATAIDRMDNRAWRRPDMKMVGRSLIAQSISIGLNGLTGTLSGGASSANLGLAHASGITARAVGVVTGLMLIGAAFIPALPSLLVVIPDPVIGAMMIYAAGYMMVAGTELILSRMLNARRTFVVGLGLAIGFAITIHPQLAAEAPPALASILSSGLAAGSIATILLNLLFRIGVRRRATVRLEGARAQHDATLFLEEHGGDWGARRDVITRAGISVGEAVEALRSAGRKATGLELSARFDEFNLDIEITHDGPPLLVGTPQAAHTPAELEALLDGDDTALDLATSRLSSVLIARLADRVRTRERNGRSVLMLHFDH